VSKTPAKPAANNPSEPGSGTEVDVRVSDVILMKVLSELVCRHPLVQSKLPSVRDRLSGKESLAVGKVSSRSRFTGWLKSSHDMPDPGTSGSDDSPAINENARVPTTPGPKL